MAGMRFSHGFIDELLNRVSIAEIVGRRVSWDMRKSNPGKGDMWACCPFHQEKTPSFHVDDRKGYYYCFGCHAKGSVFTFLREMENMQFMDAVEMLAREVGMSLPVLDPATAKKAGHLAQLVEVNEQALKYFRLQLRAAAAAKARDYLEGRGLVDETLDRWEIGFAPQRGLSQHLIDKGLSETLLLDAGLIRKPEDGGKPYETFRNRIMFPIRDVRGRAVAFGGRAMDAKVPAKYINSPETDIFDKGRSLYNHERARAAIGSGRTLIVVEGYMDVIALSEAGYGAVVAPLGTAITESQLRMLWSMASEPVISLDGDAAGMRAAMRLVDMALPLLETGKSLRFAILPEGQDPDDLLRAGGASAVKSVLDAAQPIVAMLWNRETEGRMFDTPEQRAGLDKALDTKTNQIRDANLRRHYFSYFKDLKWRLFRGVSGTRARSVDGWPAGRGNQPGLPIGPTRASANVVGGAEAERSMRLEVILATAMAFPELVEEFESELGKLHCSDQKLDNIRRLLLQGIANGTESMLEWLNAELGENPLEKLLRQRHVASSPAMRCRMIPDSRKEDLLGLASMTLTEELAKVNLNDGLNLAIAEAVEDIADADESDGPRILERLAVAASERENAFRGSWEDIASSDTAESRPGNDSA